MSNRDLLDEPARPPSSSTPSRTRGAVTTPIGVIGAPEEWHFLDYVRILSKRRWTALPVFAVVLLIVAIGTYLAAPLYEARAQVLIESENQNVVMFKELVEQDKATTDYYQTQYKILQSRALAKLTIDRLNLWNNIEWGGKKARPTDKSNEPKPSAVTRALDSIGTTFGSGFARLGRLVGMAPPLPTAQVATKADPTESRNQSTVIQAFLANLTISPVKNSRLVDIRFSSGDPKIAATVANGLIHAYIDRNLELKFQGSKEASDWLTTQLADQRKKVEESEDALQHYREKNDAIASENTQSVTLQKFNDLNGALIRAKMDRLQKEAIYKQVAAVASDPGALDSVPAITAKPVIERLRSELSTLERQHSQLSKQLGDQHPDIVNLRANIQVTQSKLRTELDVAVNSLANELAAAQAQERQFTKAVDAQKAELLALNRREIGYRALERDATSNQQIFQSLLQRTKETGISSELKANNIRIIDEADIPRAPVWPQTGLNLTLGAIAGTLLGIALAFVAEYMDHKIKSPEEIKRHLGLPCLGMVPLIEHSEMPATGAPMLNNGVPAQFAEAFRVVRTKVLFSAEGETHRTVVVTSTGPSEGKTVVSSNLAAGLALAEQRVLLVDADMRKPQIHKMFGLPQEIGLAGVLTGEYSIADTLQRTSIPALMVMAAGSLPSNPAELLSSPQFHAFLQQVSAEFDWIIIDSPPVMAVTDAALLAHAAMAVIFVVGAEQVDVPNAIRAIEQLEEAKAVFVGAVLNKVNLKRNAYFYSQHHRAEYSKYYVRDNVQMELPVQR